MNFPRLTPIIALILLAGCFETKFSLGPEDKAAVNTAFVGDWEAGNPAAPDDPKSALVIRNLDGKRYFVQWTDPKDENGKEKVTRMVGFIAEVKGVSFAHLRNLTDDGTIPQKHLGMRVELKDEKITLRNLSDEFFKNNPPAGDADFRRLVEENLDNAAMYDEDVVVATRSAR